MKLIRLIPLVVLAACAAEPQPLGVHETIKNIQALNGKIVRVAGYLGDCGGYDCGLFENEAERQYANQYFATVRATHRPPASKFPDWLSSGTGELKCPSPNARSGCYFEFDQKAAPLSNSYVVITGTVTNKCRDEKGEPGGTDRCPDLEPISIEAWTHPQATNEAS